MWWVEKERNPAKLAWDKTDVLPDRRVLGLQAVPEKASERGNLIHLHRGPDEQVSLSPRRAL